VIWTAKITNLGHPETIYCRHAYPRPDALHRKQWRAFDKDTLVERSQDVRDQYETQQESSNKIIHVHGSWLSSFYFAILASHPRDDQEFCYLEVRLCPAALLIQGRAESLAYEANVPIRGKHLLKNLAELAASTSRVFQGWLGHFFSEHNVLIYWFFEDYHSGPWGQVMDPLLKIIIEHVEDAWLSLRSATVLGPPEIIQHVEAAWCAGDAYREMDPT